MIQYQYQHCIDTIDIWIDLSTTNVYSKCALLVLLLLQDVLIPLTKVTKPTLEKFIVDSSLLLCMYSALFKDVM